MVFIILFQIFTTLGQNIPVQDLSRPEAASADSVYADVFKPLDGIWQGTFYVYIDEQGQRKETARPLDIHPKLIKEQDLKEKMVIEVRQEYVSETPFFQRVKIRDTYFDEKGTKRVVESHGVNKVHNGKLWCVVIKPDETVVHSGLVAGKETIIWQRNLPDPLKIEYFRETVLDKEYEIIGWGYYGTDDPELSPRYWFYGKYHRLQ